MRIAFSSDFHIDASETNRKAVENIAERMRAAAPDVVVIAGDVGNTLEQLGETLTFFSDLCVPKFFVAGNHDVWVEEANPDIDSREKYEVRVPRVCDQFGFTDLSREPVIIDNVGFVGSLGWYDYSFADPMLDLAHEDYWRGRYEDRIWWDKEMAFWSSRGGGNGASGERIRDPEVCQEMVATLGTHLQTIEGRVDRIIAVVHTLPFLQTLPRSDPPYYLDAFTGAAGLGETLARCDKVTHQIGGHKHLNGDWSIGRIQSSRRTLGRLDDDASIEEAVKNSVGVIEV
jgi:3',5'-cyclic AMP phosphodiesterase CpdA